MKGLKTKRGVKKRFSLSKRKKVKYMSGGKSHLATSKTSKRLRKLRRAKILEGKKLVAFVQRMLPYG